MFSSFLMKLQILLFSSTGPDRQLYKGDIISGGLRLIKFFLSSDL